MKKNCHISNQYPRMFLIAKIRKRIKMSKFGANNALFGFFWPEILNNYCHIWNQYLRASQKWVFNSYIGFCQYIEFSCTLNIDNVIITYIFEESFKKGIIKSDLLDHLPILFSISTSKSTWKSSSLKFKKRSNF